MNFLPAATVRAMLAGFRALGLDAEAIRAAAGLSVESLAPVDATAPLDRFRALWEEAARRAPRHELVTEVALAIPFGAFGALDYLAGSSPTVGAAFRALAAHFRYVAQGITLELHEASDAAEVRLVNAPGQDGATRTSSRLPSSSAGSASARRRSPSTRSGSPPPTPAPDAPRGPPRRAGLVRQRRRGAPAAAGGLASADAVGQPGAPGDAARARRARGARRPRRRGPRRPGAEPAPAPPPRGAQSAPEVAEALGVSERTLHRRLKEEGATFRAILEAFREASAERLLSAAQLTLGEVALRLGFSDQTAWNRAFRRWKGMSPTEWAERRGGR